MHCPIFFMLNLSWVVSCCRSIFKIYVHSHVNAGAYKGFFFSFCKATVFLAPGHLVTGNCEFSDMGGTKRGSSNAGCTLNH